MAINKLIEVEVVYALPEQQVILKMQLEQGATIAEAIERSGILRLFPAIDLASQKVGVFGKLRLVSDKLQDGDRVEIYRPLTIDPKDARRAKAKKKK